MDATVVEAWAATREPPRAGCGTSQAQRGSPQADGALRWLALPPADAARIARWVDASVQPVAPVAAIVVVDALSRLPAAALDGIRAFLGRHPGASAVVVDRMDDAGCEYGVFDAQRARLTAAGIAADLFVPATSSTGEGLVSGPDRIDWYRGPTLGQWLGSLPTPGVAGRIGRAS
jgi:hypothetical protein